MVYNPSPVCVKNKSMQKEDVRPAFLSVEKAKIITLKESSFLGSCLP